ncbi:hypothetical protein GCM10009765_03070 [Fodinicola feengrottensis]|uniref:Uncharacterized protein n=1 Tax=Fodinicola feengrottensis TaxID=435914 RepID=A0ABN2FRM6_9ACTN
MSTEPGTREQPLTVTSAARTVADQPRLFYLWRVNDISGVSGRGLVSWGVEWPNGRATTQWNGPRSGIWQTSEWDRTEDIIAVHGHDGATRLLYLPRPGVCEHCLTIAGSPPSLP